MLNTRLLIETDKLKLETDKLKRREVNMRQLKRIIMVGILVFLIGFSTAEAVDMYQGELKGSKIFIAVPEKWNKDLLILAHGGTEGRLSLSGNFDSEKKFYKTLLNEGWMIASTSYRRTGAIFHDAVEDIGYLREHVINTYGQPSQIYIDGHSMGGAIGTLIAENHFNQYTGLLLIDPALSERIATIYKVEFNYKPMIPILFLCNQDEVAATRTYMEKLAPNAVQPGFWIIRRDGHVNINDDEELLAVKALVDFANDKQIPKKRDLLIIPKDQPSKALFKDGGAYSKVIRIHPKWGNIDTELVPSDMEKLGIKTGDTFTLAFNKKTAKVYLGKTFGDVAKGEWIAFFKEDGLLQVARNLERAEKILGCKEGDMVFIQK